MAESKILQSVFFESPWDYFKLLVGIGDTDSLTQQYLLETNHWDTGIQAISSEGRNVIRFNSLLQFVSFNEPVVHVLFMSMISTLSSIYLFRVVATKTIVNPILAISLLSFLPNVLFWSCGILKEPFYLLGFSLILYSLFLEKRDFKTWLTFVIGVLLLLLFKLHFLIIVLIGMSIWQLSRFFDNRKILYTVLTTLVAATLLFAFSQSLRSKVTNTISRKQFDFNNISKGGVYIESEGSVYYFSENKIADLLIENDSIKIKRPVYAEKLEFNNTAPLDTTLFTQESGWLPVHFYMPKSQSHFTLTEINSDFNNLITMVPEALVNSLFRPFVKEHGGLLKWVSIFEWLFVWTLFIISLKRIPSLNNQSKEMVLLLGTVIILSALLIGWTTPVSGAIVRYRVPIHISMVLIILINWNQKSKTNE